MRSVSFKNYKKYIRSWRNEILEEIKSADNYSSTRSSIIMCRVWTCRGMIENVNKNIYAAYFENNSMTQMEYRTLEKYMDMFSDFVWSEFYDKASEQDRKLQTLKYQLEKERT